MLQISDGTNGIFLASNLRWFTRNELGMDFFTYMYMQYCLYTTYIVYTASDHSLYCSLLPSKYSIKAELLQVFIAELFAPANWRAVGWSKASVLRVCCTFKGLMERTDVQR